MRFDPSELKAVGFTEVGSSNQARAAQMRQHQLSTRKLMEMKQFWKPGYKPPTTLEKFLLAFPAKGFRHVDGPQRGELGAPLHAPEFGNDMGTLIVSCKLFVQDRIASGLCTPARPKHIFALHIYTLDTSVFRDMNFGMMRQFPAAVCCLSPFSPAPLRPPSAPSHASSRCLPAAPGGLMAAVHLVLLHCARDAQRELRHCLSRHQALV